MWFCHAQKKDCNKKYKNVGPRGNVQGKESWISGLTRWHVQQVDSNCGWLAGWLHLNSFGFGRHFCKQEPAKPIEAGARRLKLARRVGPRAVWCGNESFQFGLIGACESKGSVMCEGKVWIGCRPLVDIFSFFLFFF